MLIDPDLEDAYRERFGSENMPDIFACPDLAQLEAMMREALKRGKPISRAEYKAAFGFDPADGKRHY